MKNVTQEQVFLTAKSIKNTIEMLLLSSKEAIHQVNAYPQCNLREVNLSNIKKSPNLSVSAIE